jgi:hypothetical protein
MSMTRLAVRIGAAALLTGALGVSGCSVSRYHLADDYGRAVRQDVAAQIADPDARYVGDPAPGSDGKRTSLAQTKYETNTVTPPASTSTSAVSVGGGGGGGGK